MQFLILYNPSHNYCTILDSASIGLQVSAIILSFRIKAGHTFDFGCCNYVGRSDLSRMYDPATPIPMSRCYLEQFLFPSFL